MTAEQLIQQFNLQPHPEGGYFREVYRSQHQVTSPLKGETRDALTHIYFLLPKGEVSRFHRVSHDEVWNLYAGAPLRLLDMAVPDVQEVILGPEQGAFAHVIAAGRYQAAESTGDFSLVGCSVAPGFDFSDFNFIDPDSPEAQYVQQHPELSAFL